jgi:tetratricopeptide (TPR) repeat protein
MVLGCDIYQPLSSLPKRNRQRSDSEGKMSVVLLLLVIFVTPAIAQPKLPATCERSLNPERILACTELLRQEQSPDKLVAIYRNRGQAYWSSRQYDLAVKDYDIVLALDPNHVHVLYERGWAFYSMRQFDRAVADADRLIAMGEKSEKFAVHQLRCRALGELGRFDEAIRSCSEQLRRHPGDTFLEDRGEVYLLAGQYDRAMEDFDAVLKINNQSYSAILGRGKAMFAKQDYAAALDEFDRANGVSQGASGDAWPIALSKRGLANEALGRRSAAIADFQEALRRQPDLDESKEGLKRLGVSPTSLPERP